jgi:hypothetical protein
MDMTLTLQDLFSSSKNFLAHAFSTALRWLQYPMLAVWARLDGFDSRRVSLGFLPLPSQTTSMDFDRYPERP